MDRQSELGKPAGFDALFELATDISTANFADPVERSTPKAIPDTTIVSKKTPKTRINENSPIIILSTVVVIIAVWIIYESGAQTTSTVASSTDTQQTTDQAAQVPPPASSEEDIPPVGNGLLLTSNEVRYCLSQSTRLSAAQHVVDMTNQAEIDQYDSLINDYNSRCANFQYTAGTLQPIQAEVDANASVLQAQGRSLISK
jgi:hypothetical protein